MKKFLTLGFVAATALALTTGCQKKEAAAPEAAPAAEAPAVVEETGTAATTGTDDHDDHDHDHHDRDRPGDGDPGCQVVFPARNQRPPQGGLFFCARPGPRPRRPLN